MTFYNTTEKQINYGYEDMMTEKSSHHPPPHQGGEQRHRYERRGSVTRFSLDAAVQVVKMMERNDVTMDDATDVSALNKSSHSTASSVSGVDRFRDASLVNKVPAHENCQIWSGVKNC
jgi:hypothetical protein